MTRSRLVLALLLVAVGCGDSVDPLVSPGVPLALAESRRASISDLRYEVAFEVPASREEAVTGTVTASFDWAPSRDNQALVLDFRAPRENVRGVLLDGDSVEYELPADHIVLPWDAVAPGRHSVTVAFTSTEAALNRQPEFMYALFVPDRASTAMPVFEQPDLKARFTLSLTVPREWKALSNGALTGEDTVLAGAGRRTLRFAETEPISTYLFTFAAGVLQEERAVRNGRTFTMYHRETDAAKVARNRDAIFDLHAASLAWLEDYTGIAYPFGKFAFFAVPAFQFGGMEHPGAIWYRADALFLDPTATRNQELGRASVIAHETAHMWFGDLVTMEWFNDVWMKEVFANFMAAKVVAPSFPDIDHRLRFFLAHHPAAYAVDRTAGANPIRQPLENLRDAGSLYGAIIYQKAPIVMRQLEAMVGDTVLRDGLRRYLDRYRFGNATWPELVAIVDSLSPEDVTTWSRAWVEEPGRPTIQLTASDSQIGGADGLGYGRYVMDSLGRAALLTRVAGIPNDLRRAVAWHNLYEEMLYANLAPRALLDTVIAALPFERNELIASQLLGFARSIHWRFLDAAAREQEAPRLEEALWRELERAPTPGRKGAYFGTLVGVATTPATLARLERIWRKDETPRGLPLTEAQYTNLAEALAIRGVPNAESILDEEERRITNPDRRERFRFMRPALSADVATRRALFRSFEDVANRRRESWVLDAMGAINHPLRAADALPDLRAALELVDDIQRTGDIFFPLRWLNAAMDGHQSVEAAEVVRAFLAERPDLEPRLRGKVLQAADDLFRASELVRYPK